MDKKDFKYLIGISIFVNVCIFTFYYGGREDIVSYVGFAGTLMSIVLSVLAIVYTYYQNATSVSGIQKIEKASERFEQIVDKFETVQTELAATSCGITKVDQGISELTKLVSSSAIINAPPDLVDSKDKIEKGRKATIGEIRTALGSVSMSGLAVLKLCISQSKNPKSIPLQELLDEFLLRSEVKTDRQYLYGFLIGFNCTDLLSIKIPNMKTKMTVSLPHPTNFEKALDEVILRAIDKYGEERQLYFAKISQALVEMYETAST